MTVWHLEYSFDVDAASRMIYGKIYGIWRGETAEAYETEFKIVSEPLLKKPWAKLIDLSNWRTASQGAIEVIGRLNKWCRVKNMEWAVYVIDNPVAYPQLTRMFEKGKYRDLARTFRTLKEAEKFLEKQGYKVGPEQSGSRPSPFL